MPLFGTLDLATAFASAPTVTSLAPETLDLPGTDVLQVSYEVVEADALAITPPGLHPSIPPYATFNFWRCPTSPVGPFTVAMVRLIVRAGIRPRALLVAGFCDSEVAAAALSGGWGYRLVPAEVTLQRRHDQISGTVRIDGFLALDARLHDPEPVAGSDLELFDNLHLVRVEGEGDLIAQVDPGYTIHKADRGEADLVVYEPDLLGAEGVVPDYALIAVAASADVELAAPRFVMDPAKPAFQGTRRLR